MQRLRAQAVPALQRKAFPLGHAQQVLYVQHFGLPGCCNQRLLQMPQPGAGHVPLDSTAPQAAISLANQLIWLRLWKSTLAGTRATQLLSSATLLAHDFHLETHVHVCLQGWSLLSFLRHYAAMSTGKFLSKGKVR